MEDLIQRKPEDWDRFLEFTISLTRAEVCSATCVITLLTDLVELSPLDACPIVFDSVESRLDVWKEPLFYTSGKNAVLRMCNGKLL